MKRCKYCGAVHTEKGCPNNTCIAYTKPEVTQVTLKKRKTKKIDVDNVDNVDNVDTVDTVEADIKR